MQRSEGVKSERICIILQNVYKKTMTIQNSAPSTLLVLVAPFVVFLSRLLRSSGLSNVLLTQT